MTLEEKALAASTNNLRIAENQRRVYESGWEQGEQEGWSDGWSEGNEYGRYEGWEEGRQAVWAVVQQKGNRTDYTNAFAYWGNTNFIPTYPIRPIRSGYMFMGAKITEIPDGGHWDFSQSTAMTYVFSSCSIQRVVPSISTVSASDLSALFGWNSAIKEIGEIVLKEDGSQKVTYMFDNCYNLEVVNFRGKFGQNISFAQSTKLSQDSIYGIITALSDTASGKTLTLSRTAVNNAWGGTEESEWLDLVASKPNWTISLI